MLYRRNGASIVAAAALVAIFMLAPSGAAAATYDVYSCRIPYGESAGSPAPVEVASEAAEEPGRWSRSATGEASTGDSCASGGALLAAIPAGATHTEAEEATWRFTAPAGERIAAAALWRAGDAEGGDGYLFWLATPSNPGPGNAEMVEDMFTGCAYLASCTKVGSQNEPLAAQNLVSVPEEQLGGSHLYLDAGCSRATCPNEGEEPSGYAAAGYLYAADITLEDDTPPTVSGLSGPLYSQEDVSGQASLRFHASDSGSGVYQEIVRVDGAIASEQVIDEEEGRCRQAPSGPDRRPAFLYAQPCPSSTEGAATLDTSTLSDGPHSLTVTITDAAGNETTALQRSIDVQNGGSGSEAGKGTHGGGSAGAGTGPGAGPGTGANAGGQAPSSRPADNGLGASAEAKLTARWARASGASPRKGGKRPSSVRSSFGVREAIVGRLTTRSGKPIAHATLSVREQDLYGGSRAVRMAPARTGPDGRFLIRLARRTPSKKITIRYDPTKGSVAGAISRTLTLMVHAGVRLHVTPRRASVGTTIELSGRVLGGPIPHGGKQVVLEARSKGSGWVKFDVVSAGRDGRFHAAHRFRLPGPVRYSFRALCVHEADFPFLSGSSNVVKVWES